MSKYSINITPKDLLREISIKTKVLRKSHRLTQIQLAEKSGVSHGSIKRFETTGQISLDSLLKIAHVLNRLDDFKSIFKATEEESKEHLFTIN